MTVVFQLSRVKRIPRAGWFRKGEQTRTPQPAKRQRATLFGALHLRTQRFYWKRAERGISKVLIGFLHQLHQRFPEHDLVIELFINRYEFGRAT